MEVQINMWKLIYESNKYKIHKLKILNKDFIKNNKYRCKIIYKNNLYNPKEYFDEINRNHKSKDLLSIKLILFNNIIDAKSMFQECDSLISINDVTKKYIRYTCNNPYLIRMKDLLAKSNLLQVLTIKPKKYNIFTKKIDYMFNKC